MGVLELVTAADYSAGYLVSDGYPAQINHAVAINESELNSIMVWVWRHPREDDEWGANIDYEASKPLTSYEYLRANWVDPATHRPVFRSQTGLKKFKMLHCPPIWVAPAVDAVWRDIILKFVPAHRVQFLPIRLIARGETCDDYFWPIVMDRVCCIDPEKSVITQQIKDEKRFIIFGVAKFVHVPNCLGNLHLARDARMDSHLLVSDDLKQALSATGEDSMFYRPEDVVTIDTMVAKEDARKLN